MAEFSRRTRKIDIQSIKEGNVKCLIIGGGIVGAGLANILAQNRIGTVLVEKGDFASGTSSASSKLIHGGIRYLAQGHVKLTRDLLKERNYLIKNTGIVRRLDFDILVDDYSWSASYIRLGLFLYSILGGRPGIPRMKRNRGRYIHGVRGYFPYYDGITDDSRMVIDNIVSAHNHGAICLNYVAATSLRDEDGKVAVSLKDRAEGIEFEVKADLVVNCTGPWVNKVLSLYSPDYVIAMKLSKGVHLIIPRDKIVGERAITFRSHIDGRQMFAIPRESVWVVGTTDSLVDSPDSLSITDEEENYIMESIKRLFPDLKRGDILARYCGIRPLVGKGSNPDRISRDFEIFRHGNMITVAGVKLTDFRQAARKAANVIASIEGLMIKTYNLPVIDYERPEGVDLIQHIIDNECPLTISDVTRRRLGTDIYDPGRLDHVRDMVSEAFSKKGDEAEIELA